MNESITHAHAHAHTLLDADWLAVAGRRAVIGCSQRSKAGCADGAVGASVTIVLYIDNNECEEDTYIDWIKESCLLYTHVCLWE